MLPRRCGAAFGTAAARHAAPRGFRKGSYVRGHKNRRQAIQGCRRRKDQGRTDCCGRWPGDRDRPGAGRRRRRGPEGRGAPGRRREREGHRRGARQARQGAHLQDAPPQALPEAWQGHRQNFTELRSAPSTPESTNEEFHHGTEKRRRLHAQRPRLAAEDARRQGVRRPGGVRPARSSCASAAPSSTPARTSAWAGTTRCSRWSTARSPSPSRARRTSQTVSVTPA